MCAMCRVAESAVAIIQPANLLQVTAMEVAAVEFLPDLAAVRPSGGLAGPPAHEVGGPRGIMKSISVIRHTGLCLRRRRRHQSRMLGQPATQSMRSGELLQDSSRRSSVESAD